MKTEPAANVCFPHLNGGDDARRDGGDLIRNAAAHPTKHEKPGKKVNQAGQAIERGWHRRKSVQSKLAALIIERLIEALNWRPKDPKAKIDSDPVLNVGSVA